MNVLFPISEATEEEYAKAVAESNTRLWSFHQEDPSSRGAHWNFHETSSPYKEVVPELVALWHPEGVGRDFASRVLNQVYWFIGERLWRPHCQLDYMFTYTNQRCKGYGSMLMQWGMERAEKMGLEVIVESSEMGYSLYKEFGLRPIEKIAVDMRVENPSNTWRRLESDLGPVLIWWMRKPHGGV
ncbi:GNAT family acetyltransferase [Sclerotinia borealis F-4128]|uniref:GNAT family acetyltransferase n=1 Tax=Sclerotinia borealis (strain F-4128) TaxID=1432307 RepID=W9C378_SCLBF|nr:GNAT family acetyltransferase [Sclerotinia borealis F-4128]